MSVIRSVVLSTTKVGNYFFFYKSLRYLLSYKMSRERGKGLKNSCNAIAYNTCQVLIKTEILQNVCDFYL